MKVLSCCLVVLLGVVVSGQFSRLNPLQTARAIGGTALNITGSVVAEIPDILPSPSDLVNLGLNVVMGYPAKYVITAINEFCSIAVNSEAIRPKITPETKEMSFIFKTKNNSHTVNLMKPLELLDIPEFKKNGTLVLFISGWTTDLSKESEDIGTMSEAFKCRDDVNFVVIDSARFIDTLYSWSALNTEAIGEDIGHALAELTKAKGITKIHIIGHSLGAQISGAAGRKYEEETGKLIPHITGLDPARPCFNEGEALTGLGKGDAAFVDVIHTNPGVLGQKQPIGDIDFYPNGVRPIPPTCVDVLCAHSMAWRLYAEASYPGNENAFNAVKCNSLMSLETSKCKKSKQAFMGPFIDHSTKGNFFLRTNDKRPYGLASDQKKLQC